MSALTAIFEWIWRSSWQAAILVLLVLLAQALFRHRLSAAWRAALWLVVVVRLLLPAGYPSRWSLPGQLQHWTPASAELLSPNRRVGPPGDSPLTMEPSATLERRAGTPADAGVGSTTWDWRGWAAVLWLGGTALLLGRWTSQNWRFARRLGAGRRVDDSAVLGLLAECQARAGVTRSLELIETDAVNSPALYGLWRSRLLLPRGVVAALRADELRYLFLHELAHLRRRDPALNWLFSILRLVHWFNPLIGLAFRRVRRDRELACDERVLTMTQGREAERYGRALIRLLEFGVGPGRHPALTGIVENKSEIERRLQMIANFTACPRCARWALPLMAVLGWIALTDAHPGAATANAAAPASAALDTSAPPRIVATVPAVGATEVDPNLTEITVTFDRPMGQGYSWTGGGPDFPPAPDGTKAAWRDARTCVLPVKLEAARYYRVGINSTSYRSFQSAQGVPANPAAVYFTTRGASAELMAKARKPEIVAMTPANGATEVDPALKELRVTFSVPMGPGFSWTGGGPQFPEIPAGQKPSWSADGKTCVLPVSLKPGWDYRLGLNSPSHRNFQSSGGVPLDPVAYSFRTRAR